MLCRITSCEYVVRNFVAQFSRRSPMQNSSFSLMSKTSYFSSVCIFTLKNPIIINHMWCYKWIFNNQTKSFLLCFLYSLCCPFWYLFSQKCPFLHKFVKRKSWLTYRERLTTKACFLRTRWNIVQKWREHLYNWTMHTSILHFNNKRKIIYQIICGSLP